VLDFAYDKETIKQEARKISSPWKEESCQAGQKEIGAQVCAQKTGCEEDAQKIFEQAFAGDVFAPPHRTAAEPPGE
jgi:hypothetical protein